MTPTLDRFSQSLRPYQAAALDRALAFVESAPPGAKRLYCAPTGSGKGSLQLALLRALRAGGVDALLVSPSLEVLRGVVERCGAQPAPQEDALVAQAEHCYATTPTRLRNRILDGSRGMPQLLIYDEAHHATEAGEVSGTLAALSSECVWLGFTATPYRASPRETQALHALWGEPEELLTLSDAISGGYVALPSCRVVPLLDDDEVAIQGGEFQVKAASAAWGSGSGSRLAALADLLAELGASPPTVCVVPGTDTCGLLVEALEARGLRAVAVTQATTGAQRAAAYAECAAGQALLVSIRVLGEGVDFPWLRRYVDASPTTSPVAFLQRLGRIMRPHGEEGASYICTNRNLERHAYLLAGLIPRTAVAAAQQAFGASPSKRTASRFLGLEKLGRFKPAAFPLADGVTGHLYALQCPREGGRVELVCVVDPAAPSPLYAERTLCYAIEGPGRYGPWTQIPCLPEGLTGFASLPSPGAATEKQKAWWTKAARSRGLDERAAATLTRKQFVVLPTLCALKLRLGTRGPAKETA